MTPRLLLAIGAILVPASLRAAPPPPDATAPWWAYGFFEPPAPGEKAKTPVASAIGLRPGEDVAEQTRPRRVDGAARSFSLVEIRHRMDVVDWFPNEHPPMPRVVKHGSASLGDKAYGCALCHMPHGKGRPENAPVSGLPPAYFIRQLQDFRQGLRRSSEPRKGNALLMIELAKAMTDEEMKEAAEYYAALPAEPWVRVEETERVPPVKPTPARMLIPLSAERTEPIGHRIIEVPENVTEVEMANPHVGFVAYVPVGSVKRGETLVTTGGATVVDGQTVPGKTVACITCHGPDLKGLNDSPPIAGRSPSYVVRQLNDMKLGTRHSPLAQTMGPVLANLTPDDFIDIAAYVTSLGSRR